MKRISSARRITSLSFLFMAILPNEELVSDEVCAPHLFLTIFSVPFSSDFSILYCPMNCSPDNFNSAIITP